MNNLAHRIIFLTATSFVVLQAFSAPVFAADTERVEIRQELRQKVGSPPGILRKFFDRAAIGSGILCSKSGDSVPATLVVKNKDGKKFTVSVDAKTQLRRRFWGKATLAEMQPGNCDATPTTGDTVNVIGLWTDDTKTTIQARLVRDVSIQKRKGIFFGTVQSLTTDGFTMQTINRGMQTVTLSSTTKIVNRKEATIAKGDIKVGDRVRVRGVWDSKLNTLTEVDKVKDFSLPPRITGTVTPTATPTATPTP